MKTTRNLARSAAIALSSLAFAASCGDANSSSDITSFVFAVGDNATLAAAVRGEIVGSAISLVVPNGISLTGLRPTIEITGASVAPASGVLQDFTAPLTYTVTASDGTTRVYTVTVTEARATAHELTQFAIPSLGVAGIITGLEVSVTVPFGTVVSALVPIVTMTGIGVNPPSGAAQDFTHPVTYTVTAANGTTAAYVVTVHVTPNSTKEITAFTLPGLGLTGVISGSQISFTAPFGTPLTALATAITFAGATVTPESGVAANFSAPVTYTVTAADGSKRAYVVQVLLAPNSARDLTAFGFGSLGVTAIISGSSVAVTVPFGTNVTALAPTITITGDHVSPASGVATDFTQPVAYTVTASNGATNIYTVTVTAAPNQAKDITRFTVLSLSVEGIISGTSISVTVPFGTDVTVRTPVVSITGSTVSPASGAMQSFTNPVIYTVTAADGSMKSYTVTMHVAPNTAKEITQFALLGYGIAGIISGSTIAITVPFGTDVTARIPTITTTGASVSPASGALQSFAAPVVYTVTAADGSTRAYTVTMHVAPNTAREISEFTLGGLGIEGILTGTSIAITVPFGTDVTAQQVTVSTTGASVSPASGSIQNFTNPVTFTVTAADGQTRAYTVTVRIAPNSAKDITRFSLLGLGVYGIVSGSSISVTVPFGTDVTARIPTISITGASVSPVSGAPRDFTAPVTYTVTAADGSTRAYVVTLNIAANSSKDITKFTLATLGIDGVISGTSIAVTVPFGTNVTARTPTLTITGASVSPVSGAPHDFTTPATYTVTAANGTTRDYTVTMRIAPNAARDITAFQLLGLGIDGVISGSSITVTVPFGTDVKARVPTLAITGNSVSPASGLLQDFTAPVVYTVTAADGSTHTYAVTMVVAANSAKDLTSFRFLGIGVDGVINGTNITATVPFGTDVTVRSPVYVTTGASVIPASGSLQDFTNPLVYTVTAADGSTKAYTVTMTVAANTAKEITRFALLGIGVDGVINGLNISVAAPIGTDPMTRTPTVTFTGASISPASGSLVDLTNPVTYTVTAADGSTKAYIVTMVIQTIAGIDLGTAANYVILSKGGISTAPTSAITGNIAVSPAAATYITGFSLAADATNVFSLSTQVVGKVYAPGYAAPTPSNLTTAVGDMETAFTAAAGRTPAFIELHAGDLSGKTLVPGVYKWGTGVLITSDVTLAGNATDVWVFEIAQGLTVGNGVKVLLSGAALPKNIFWQVGGAAVFGTTSHAEGIVLSKTAITLGTGASINGRLLAQTTVALDSSTVTQPAP